MPKQKKTKKQKTQNQTTFVVYIFHIKYLGIFQPQGIICCVLGTHMHTQRQWHK